MNRITKLVLISVLSLLSLSTPALAQRVTGTITAGSGADNVVQLNPNGTSQTVFIGLQITGSGTYAVEYLPINSTTWTSLKSCVKLTDFSAFTSTTSSLDISCINIGFQSIRVRATSYSSGTGTIALNAADSKSVVGINFGGGGSTIGAVTQGAASDSSNNWTVNCVTGCSSGTLSNNSGAPTNNHAAVLTAVANAAAVNYTEGNEVLPSVNLTGDLRTIAKQSGTWNIGTVTALTGITNALPAGTNVIGHVIHDTGSTTAVTGNVTVVQPTGTNLHAVTDATSKTQIVDGSGNVIASTSNNLNVQCANCSGSGVSTADEASFTAGTSLFAGGGGFFQTTATNNALTNGQQGSFQLTAQRALFSNLRNASGTEVGTSTTPLQVSLANTAANSIAVKVDNSAVTQPVNLLTFAGSTLVADPCQVNTRVYLPLSQATSTQIVSGTSAKKIYICSVFVVAADAENISFIEGTGTVCATGTAAVIGGSTAAAGMNLAANSGWFGGNGAASFAAEGINADNLCLLQSGSGRVAGSMSYVVQ